MARGFTLPPAKTKEESKKKRENITIFSTISRPTSAFEAAQCFLPQIGLREEDE